MVLFHRIAVLSLAAFALGSAAPANAMPPLGTAANTGSAKIQIIKVGRRAHHRHRGHYGDYGYVAGTHVHAPYTYVETSHGNVVVDAPYAYVTRSRRGITVRAPYTNIQIPRY